MVAGKTAIGVVYDTTRKLVLSLESPRKRYMEPMVNVPTLPNYPQAQMQAALSDLSGLSNTTKTNANCQSIHAVACDTTRYCTNKTTGGKTWYVPALGEISAMNNVSTVQAVNTGLSRASGIVFCGASIGTSCPGGETDTTASDYFTSSTQGADEEYVWSINYNYYENSISLHADYVAKWVASKVRCVFHYGN